ncbi:alpha/beta hydrolase [Brevibacillus sp. SYP-B805]|uniref:alpha/beta hydrolase family protein n=1 Tax=Brevibacillus sp. SYP-B805 TaxID=1578199 RepID=UPI0013EAC9CA|nr:alpha/beta fold hydrolase [Brevibacillus sp. SYP-B805]NGQ96747.1 alpha/beta hydrolase [Brevibacillus sp. SYP-B805]
MERQIRIPAGQVQLAGTLHAPEGKNRHPVPLIIICHGFIGSRIGVNRLFVQAAREFAANGCMVLRFDYGGCGESTGQYGDQRFEELIRQTVHVIRYAENLKGVDPAQLILIGHSLGGAVATYAAAREKHINHLILWAPVAYPYSDILRIVGDGVYRQAKENRYADYQGYLFSSHFFDSMEGFYPLKEIGSFAGDVLIIHGSDDEVIPSKYCIYYQKASLLRDRGTAAKEIILGADHTFSNAAHKEKLFSSTVKWIAERVHPVRSAGMQARS